MIIALIIVSILFAAAGCGALIAWYIATNLHAELKAAEELLAEASDKLGECRSLIEARAGFIDPKTIQFGAAICDIEYGCGEHCGEIIDMSRYHSDGLIGVTLLSPDPRPLDTDPEAPPVIYPHSMVYKSPVGWTWRSISFPHSG